MKHRIRFNRILLAVLLMNVSVTQATFMQQNEFETWNEDKTSRGKLWQDLQQRPTYTVLACKYNLNITITTANAGYGYSLTRSTAPFSGTCALKRGAV